MTATHRCHEPTQLTAIHTRGSQRQRVRLRLSSRHRACLYYRRRPSSTVVTLHRVSREHLHLHSSQLREPLAQATPEGVVVSMLPREVWALP